VLVFTENEQLSLVAVKQSFEILFYVFVDFVKVFVTEIGYTSVKQL
jgi:hypothetical protein